MLPVAPLRTNLTVPTAGFIGDIDALSLAHVVCALGAGRMTTADIIDHAVGFELKVAVGQPVEAGQTWMVVHHRNPLCDAHTASLNAAVTVSATAPEVPAVCVGVIEGPGEAVFRAL